VNQRGPWPLVAGASVQGRDHRAAGRENQDAFRAAASRDGIAQVIAVSDGAGSRRRSALAAHVAVDVACRLLGESPPGALAAAGDWQSWLSATSQAIVGEYLRVTAAMPDGSGGCAEGDAPGEGELAATLSAAVICPPWAGFVSVGDGFGAALTAGPRERCHLVLPPRTTAGYTDFLSAPSARAVLRCFMLWDPDLSGVVLATDGCAPIALDHPGVHGLDPGAGPFRGSTILVSGSAGTGKTTLGAHLIDAACVRGERAPADPARGIRR
jgi:Protein phosphatase 2C